MEIPGQQGRGNFQGDRKYSGEVLSIRICCVYSLLLHVDIILFDWCLSFIWTKQIVYIIHGRLQAWHLKKCAF